MGEKQPDKALKVNVEGVTNVLNIGREIGCKIFIPSTIAVFGGSKFLKQKTPLDSILQPETMYGVTKMFNEQLGEYYSKKFGVDVRSIRYPGVISSEKYDFNGTTDYSTCKLPTFYLYLEIFFEALENNYYKCYLKPKTELPMVYIDDCISGTVINP
jgi:threonine 3-dehydrogenase